MKKQDILTFILAGGKGTRLYPLTKDRTKPAVPFAGRYRIIDFVLSSCINSGLRHIYLLTQTKSQSLDQHIRLGWNFLRHELNEFIITVPAQQRISEKWYSGTADAVYQNLNLLEDHRPQYVLILSGDHIYNMDYRELLQQHIAKNSDLTICVLKIKKNEAHEFGVLAMDSEQRITQFIEKPSSPSVIPGAGDDCFINMGIYLFSTDVLAKELSEDARKLTEHDFGKNIIPSMLERCKVDSFLFENSRFGNYWRDVGTIRSYYDANMDFLKQLEQNTVMQAWPIKSVSEQLPPSYFGKANGVQINNSTIGIGSYLDECLIENSLIGRNVTVGKGSKIIESVIMNDCKIGNNCTIRESILDFKVTIPNNVNIGVNMEEDQKQFTISNGITVLPKKYQL